MKNVIENCNEKLRAILHDYSNLPEYSEMPIPDVNSKSLFGDYPINIAASRGVINEITVLLSNGADINSKGEHNFTPLHNAVEQGHVDVVDFLIKNNADLNLKNIFGNTPIELAVMLEEIKILDTFKRFIKK